MKHIILNKKLQKDSYRALKIPKVVLKEVKNETDIIMQEYYKSLAS